MSLLDDRWIGRIYIGEWTKGGAGESPVVEPATGNELSTVGLASTEDVTRACATAAEAQREWIRRPYNERAAVLQRAAALFEEHTPEIAEWVVKETGGIRPWAGFQTGAAVAICQEAAALAAMPYGEVLRSGQPRLSIARRVPVGVVGVIAPFNAPIILSLRAIAPALALGNGVVLKPDLRSAVAGGASIVRIFEEAGLPPGLLGLVNGGADIGEALVVDRHVRVIAFTGSTRAGRAVGALAGQHLKRAHLELGGNSALIILDDVDPEEAASIGAFGSYFHQGQICMATSRHLVQQGVAEAYVERLSVHAGRLPVGNPATEEVAVGPIIDAHQRDAVHDVVTASVAAGARLVTGGTFEGLFYRPTVLDHVTVDSPAFQQEIFGPVAPVTTFETVEEAIRLASDTEYGLSLGILTHDLNRALEIAEQVPTGMVHINDQTVNDEFLQPFGGVGDSGTGRVGGAEANLESFTEVQWVTIRSGLAQYPF
jgi:benzaldehyde dehydrogenase (NAD)